MLLIVLRIVDPAFLAVQMTLISGKGACTAPI
jgi:hypothetical protein